MITLPRAYEKRMRALLGNDFDKYIEAVNSETNRAFRVNSAKISVEDFEKINPFETERMPYIKNGYYLLNDEKIGNHPYHHAGMIYVQEPAAMMPAECVDVRPDWWVIDMCAAPGGKSTQLAGKLGEKGFLVSNEIISSRCKILTGNIERLGIKNAVTTCMDTAKLASNFEGMFDLVMADAPCSGEGMFRKEQSAVDEWSEDNVRMCAERQKGILDNAARLVRSGGYIVYATCTFSLDENEMVVDDFLSRHSDFEIVKVSSDIEAVTADGIRFEGCRCENIGFARRFYPHLGRGEGQFMAVLKNTGDIEDRRLPIPPKQKIDKAVYEFLDGTLEKYDKNSVTLYNGNPVFFAPSIEIKKGTAFSCGVLIGELRKNYIMPHHQFFMAMGADFKRKIPLERDSEQLLKYLRGEEIACDCDNGWAVVTVDGCVVGGAKIVSGVAKNHYPKGLRLH